MTGISIARLLADAGYQLAALSDSPRLDAELLLCQVLGKSRSYLFTWPEALLQTAQYGAFQALLERRLNGEPIAYILGHREFWSLDLEVTPDVLIPRPETECLVELALASVDGTDTDTDNTLRVADLGTGSGAIALALAVEWPQARIIATDNSHQSLTVAQRNAARLQLKNIEFRHGSWFQALSENESYTMIVSNPPYIAAGNRYLGQGDVRFEPETALVSGQDGLQALQQLITEAPAYLRAGGYLLLEHGYDQGPAVAALMRKSGFIGVQNHLDYAGRMRVCLGINAGGT